MKQEIINFKDLKPGDSFRFYIGELDEPTTTWIKTDEDYNGSVRVIAEDNPNICTFARDQKVVATKTAFKNLEIGTKVKGKEPFCPEGWVILKIAKIASGFNGDQNAQIYNPEKPDKENSGLSIDGHHLFELIK